MFGFLNSVLRLSVGLVFTGVVVLTGVVLLIPIIPWHERRIRLSNHLGTVLGRGIMWISGCTVTVRGTENIVEGRPVIFAGNHTSIFDAFTSIWLSPLGTVGVAKKQIIYYPFYGAAWLLAGHLTVDRGNTKKAKASMQRMGDFVRAKGLSLFMWPEGTRSRNGRLLPFKKGVVHLALQTGLPIVPMVTAGAHRAWKKATLFTLKSVPIDITFLPAIDTSDWSEDRIDEHLEELRAAFAAALPAEQRPADPVKLAAA